MVALTIMVAWF